MNQRERVLAVGLLALVLLLGGAFLFHLFFYEPLGMIKNRISSAEKDLETKKGELDQLTKDRERALRLDPRLKEWRTLSIPESKGRKPDEVTKHLEDMQRKYEQFLYGLLERNGFAMGFQIVSKAPDSKSSP